MAKQINGFNSDRGKFFSNEFDALKDDLAFHIEQVAGNGPVGRQVADFIVEHLTHQPDAEPPFVGFASLIARLNVLQGEQRAAAKQMSFDKLDDAVIEPKLRIIPRDSITVDDTGKVLKV